MTGYKLQIADYQATVVDPEGEKVERPVNVRDSIVGLLFHADRRLTPREVIEADKLASKIEACEEDYILLDTKEYESVKAALETPRGLPRVFTKMFTRILDAEKVTVDETPSVNKRGNISGNAQPAA